MSRRKEIAQLMNKLEQNTGAGRETRAADDEDSVRQRQANLPTINLTAYRNTDAWPGSNYALVGNSYHLETRITGPNHDLRRSACIAMLLAQGGTRRLVRASDAINNDGFNEILSCFERNWLNRVHPKTMIGPAYTEGGELIAGSFAVWRYTATTTTKTVEQQDKTPALAR